MIVKQYGITYIRVCEEHLELIRYWRNKPFIRNTMQYQDYITYNMQQEWFRKINNKYNYYFILEHEEKKIGLINCKDTNEQGVAEGGIFFWDMSYWNTPVPSLAALTMLEVIFEIFESGDTSIITVLKENKHALYFNKYLGYSVYYEDDKVYKLKLTKEDYFNKTKRLIRAAKIYMGKERSMIVIDAEPSDLLTEKINDYLRRNCERN